ncbi:cartilage intermediate layer protein 2-like isoform X1 [Nothobranchius furzeri]|uniref:cartilage intermediate layer protein 2-like isoform X1 n=1 Tax=Nothobranchius furzeri TaxID=105023 RepID=UPI002403FA60|nr:cartilage intermediate layer protein 2-like isoform X1 [Nothobranchius furzeri]
MIKLMSLIVVAFLLLAVKPIPVQPLFCWTSWYDRSDPTGMGDWEDLPDLRRENPGEICPRPYAIQAVTVDGNIPATSTGQQFYAYNTKVGFICRNEDQNPGPCLDYKVRFRCPCFSPPECKPKCP